MTPSELLRAVDSEIKPSLRRTIISCISSHANKQALIRLEESGAAGPTVETRRRSEENAYRFCVALTSLLRRASLLHRRVRLDLNLFALLRDTLNNRAQIMLGRAIARHAPEKQEPTLGIANWTELLSARELSAIEDELKYERAPRSEREEAYVDAFVTAGWLLSVQLTVIAPAPRDGAPSDLDALVFDAYLHVLQSVSFDHAAALAACQRAIERHMHDSTRAMPVGRQRVLDFRLPGWIVTAAGPWERVVVQLRERLPLVLQSDPYVLPADAPEHWDWLCQEGGPLLVCWGQFQLGKPGPYAQYRCRQLSAVCTCLDNGGERDTDVDGFGTEVTSVPCRAINVPLDRCWAFGGAPFDQIPLQTAGEAHLTLPYWPADEPSDIQRLEALGLRDVLRWIIDDEIPSSPVTRALDAFETARSLGGRYGSLLPDAERGWQTVALCTCLEALWAEGRRDDSRARVQQRMREIAGDQAAAMTSVAFDRRNLQVHNNTPDEWDGFPTFVRHVRSALGHELRRAAAAARK
jgi:hypothetical protein